jgi:hypothetical protein
MLDSNQISAYNVSNSSDDDGVSEINLSPIKTDVVNMSEQSPHFG